MKIFSQIGVRMHQIMFQSAYNDNVSLAEIDKTFKDCADLAACWFLTLVLRDQCTLNFNHVPVVTELEKV